MMKRAIMAATVMGLAAAMPRPAAADALGGALIGGVVGGVIGGAATGHAEGALVGAVVGGAAGAAIGAEAERRHNYYYYRGGCYRRVRGGYARIDGRYCY